MSVLDFGAAALVFGVFGLVLAHLARRISHWPRRLVIGILSTSIANAVADMLVRAAPQYQTPFPVYRALLVVRAVTAPLPMLLVFAYILYCCGEDWRESVFLRVLCVLSGLMAVCVSVADLVGEISPAPDYTLQIGLWPVLFFFLSTALAMVTLIALFRRWKKLTNTQRVMFLACFFMASSTMMILVEFLLVYDLIQRYLAQQEESAQQRTRIAVAQMRPHFIYNTLLSLYYLCAQDTEKTQRVIRDFTRYLQNNFMAIVEEKPILFEKELEHTRAYLAVEQACHEGSLFVEFDTPDVFFRIPALTIQPIVENAVKHGLVPGRPPLYVSIASEDTGKGVRITVEDTGPGFSTAEYDEPHITLDNIRERLRVLCGGTLTIEPREAGGTKVTVFVPHGKE
ncbi:MAG: histidine kinase [Oscillibacter sp.]|nr:histidine kinase [Oscillibacter sp.]